MDTSTRFYKTTWFMWLMLFIVSPIGIFLMWQKRLYSAQTRGILSVVFGAYFIVMMVVVNQDNGNSPAENPSKDAAAVSAVKPQEETKAATTPKATDKPEVKPAEKTTEPAKPAETAPSELKEYVPWVVKKVAGDKSNFNKVDRIRSIEYDPKSIFIELMADDGISKSSIKSESLQRSTAMLKQIFKDRTDVPKVFISWAMPLQDAKGNESTVGVINISLSAEKAKTINWDTFTYSNLPKVADSYTEHQIFK